MAITARHDRVCYRWTEAGPADVEIVDYHQERRSMAGIEPVTPGELLLKEFLAQVAHDTEVAAKALAPVLQITHQRYDLIG